jgi:hypothetical protein
VLRLEKQSINYLSIKGISMGNSYRIKANPGKDQNLVIQVDQDFEQLEILSLKVRQSDIYLRMCSDYGVIAGRVFANNGYGIPNAKVSIFIPVTDEDKKNPIINAIYPYKSVLDTNEDGYKYNLLPYLPSYSNHVPTGTFPSRKDNLVNQTVVQLYDKYYKYTVQTNDSGDYLIYGVPVGSHTIVMNVDLSDIGPFSLGPQDLVRMGIASEEQFDGNKFNASTNFNSLPQVVVINKSIEVAPFWGEPDICRIGITRTDFDITNESNIDIKPTAIFMGSLVSTSTSISIKQNCVSRKETGNQCQMITGPGEILAITQSLFHDSDGLPVLEQAKLPNGGKLIDGNGTWMFDLPMNNNYISTNEYGEQVISNDPKVGIPTKAKYRFKIKWQQSKSIAEDYKRGYFLVPNIKEKGWDFYGSDPLQGGSGDYSDALTSYAFDLGWSGYTTGTVDLTNPEILSYINCEDRFYEFDYNKVYTVSGLIDNYKVAGGKEKFLAIKRIDDDTCDDSVNKFPANDGVFHTSLLWIILNILISIIGFLMLPVLIAYDIIAFLINLIYLIIQTVLCGICGIGFSITVISFYPFGWICRSLGIDCDDPKLPIKPLDMPMITYPDCEACSCDGSDGNGSDPTSGGGNQTSSQAQPNRNQFINSFNEPTSFGSLDNPSVFASAFDNNAYWSSADVPIIKQLLGGAFVNGTYMTAGGVGRINKSGSAYFECYDLPFGERINLFNTKGSYYSGANQVKVTYEPTSNGSLSHTDNIIAIVVNKSTTFSAGTMFSFTSPYSSKDPNFTGATVNSLGSNQLTGTTTIPTTLSGTYASPSNPLVNIPFSYSTPTMYNTNVGKKLYYTYPSDIEYFQVITGMTLTNFRSLIPSSRFANSFGDVIESTSTIESHFFIGSESRTVKPIDFISQDKKILIIQRGVDPSSFKVQTKFDLSRVFGYSSMNQPSCIVTGDYKVNVPIKNSTLPASSSPLNMFKHDFAPGMNNNTPNNGFDLFFNSQFFEPANSPSYYYTGYTTHNHTLYSSLDYTKVVPSTFVPSPPAAVLSPTRIDTTVNSPRQLIKSKSGQALYSSALNPSKYGPNEFVDGGAYVFTISSTYPSNLSSYYYSPGYNTGNTLNMSYYKNTVMRSDRLPTSDFPTTNNNNTYFLQQNPALTVYAFSTGGIIVAGAGQSNASYADPFEPTDNDFETNSALNTFTCNKMVSLKCYAGDGLNMTVNPSCKNDDAVTDYGCYRFCPRCGDINDIFGPIAGMGKDLENFGEYILRFKFFFALCQGVLGQVFNNNWVNGVLVAFPFKINTYYNSKNKVNGREYCRDIVFLHPTTNTFYYRSTPWDGTKFIGEKSRGDMSNGSNDTNLKYPTTLMNLGPRDSFLKEIILNGNFNGYNMKEFSETSYNDTSDMVNFFGVIRLLDSSFLANFFGSQITKLFSRAGKKVDADFAQTVAVNSQIGVVPLDTSFYTTSPSSPGGASVIAAGTGSGNIMMGIMFTSSTESIQVRDFISPVRTIRWNPLTNDFAYDYTETKSQLTPHYMWRLNNGNTIFGNQGNNWATSPDPSSIVAVKYQQMDRLPSQLPGSPYPVWNESVNEYNARGYIFASNANDMASITYNYTAPTIMGHTILGGAPWYFYFGLRKGNTAINRFSTKFIGTTNINE